MFNPDYIDGSGYLVDIYASPFPLGVWLRKPGSKPKTYGETVAVFNFKAYKSDAFNERPDFKEVLREAWEGGVGAMHRWETGQGRGEDFNDFYQHTIKQIDHENTTD